MNRSKSLAAYEATGYTPSEIEAMLGKLRDYDQNEPILRTELAALMASMRRLNDMAVGIMEGCGDPEELFQFAKNVYDTTAALEGGQ